MAESLCEELGKEILNLSEDIAKKKIDKAQYDKSYNAVILGVNQNFVDDVPDKDKSELISKHSIPKTADNGKYYTFKINGVYYVKKSNTDFKLYEDVVIRVPNGNWNNMFIEVQRDTVSSSDEPTPTPTPTPTFDFGQVSFDKNRLYYNGETYHLQFGWNKRIMCVTKGDKHALINSLDYTGSRIEAATAVMKGLTEDWDIVFDNYCCEVADGYTLNISNILRNYSGAMKCDWGDGTVDDKDSHTYYNTACVVVKIKLLGGVSEETEISTFGITWSVTTNKRFYEENIGARLYIGGSIRGVSLDSANYVTHICFGEKVKSVKGYRSPTYMAEGRQELGIPPFVETISAEAFRYNGASYIYIPESCVSIGATAFYYNGASEIEIEEKGETLTIGENAFGDTSAPDCFNRLDVLRIPSRVVQENNGSIAHCCYTRALIFGRGRTEIPSFLCYQTEMGVDSLSEIKDEPYFIFIPKTVKSIGDFLLYNGRVNRQVYIICEGRWSEINKSSDWDGKGGSRENVQILDSWIGSGEKLYKNAENIIDTFIRKG